MSPIDVDSSTIGFPFAAAGFPFPAAMVAPGTPSPRRRIPTTAERQSVIVAVPFRESELFLFFTRAGHPQGRLTKSTGPTSVLSTHRFVRTTPVTEDRRAGRTRSGRIAALKVLSARQRLVALQLARLVQACKPAPARFTAGWIAS